MMKNAWLAALAVIALAGCGGGGSSQEALAKKTPTPSPTPTPTPTPTPSPTPTPTAVNDGLVKDPAVLSLDNAQYGVRKFQGVPSVEQVGGRLWVAFLGDNIANWEKPGTYIVLQYSDDNGKSWSREYYLVPVDRINNRVYDVRLWEDPTGKLWIIYAQSGGAVGNDGQLGVWTSIVDNASSGDPAIGGGFWMADGEGQRPFEYGGKWYLPVQYYDYVSPLRRYMERTGNFFYELDWQNRRLTKVATLPPYSNRDYAEITAVEKRDGSLLVQSRSLDGILQSTTAAGSLSVPPWTRWSYSPSTYARHFLGRTPKGRLLMVFNKTRDTRERTDMTIALSDDDGATWPLIQTFDPKDQISYPDVTFTANGEVHIVYDRGRNNHLETFMATFREPQQLTQAASISIKLINKGVCATAGSKCGPQ
jgi:hypothetical protein